MRCLRTTIAATLMLLLLTAGASASEITASAELEDAGGKVVATATFTQTDGGVRIEVEAEGLEAGLHGIHFHETGRCEDAAFDSANIFLQGIDQGNTTQEKMNAYLSTVTYKGVANTYKFTDKGELDPTLIKVWAFKFDATGNPLADQGAPTT